MRKKIVLAGGSWGGDVAALEMSDTTGFIERHVDIDLCFKNVYEWLRYCNQGRVGAYVHPGFAIDILRASCGKRDAFFYGRRAFPCDQSYAVNRGDWVGYRCIQCEWTGASAGCLPKTCCSKYGTQYKQHNLRYRVELLDEFGEPFGEERVFKALSAIRFSVSEARRTEAARYVLGDVLGDVDEAQLASYLPSVGVSNQPCNRGLIERERLGYYGEFLRKYPGVEDWQRAYNGRNYRSIGLAKAVAGRVREEGEPEFRGERRNLHGYLMTSEPRAKPERSWKATKKRKQWVRTKM